MRPNEMRMVYGYGYWAFERVWECVLQITDEQFVQEIGYSRGSIRHQVVHIMSATQRWIIRLKQETMLGLKQLSRKFPITKFPKQSIRNAFGREPAAAAAARVRARAAAKTQWDQLRAETMAYINSLSEADLDAVVQWELPARELSAENARWEILLHVANHATDHRAQVLASFNQHFGIDTPEQDMLFYLLERSQ